MFRISMFAALAVVAAVAGQTTAATNSLQSPAPASTRIATFTLSGIDYRFPLPDGFCLPVGRYAEHAQRTANGDASNVTSLSFDDCGAMERNGDLVRWGMIKTPIGFVSKDAGTRASFIPMLKAQFASGEFQRSMRQGIDQTQMDIVTRVAPVGTDAHGGYIAGTLTMRGRTFSAVWGMTVIKHRLLAIYIYGPYRSQKDVDALLTLVRTTTARMIAANGGL